ncbi:MAG: hypothetical protein AMXMBFR23_24830 [Chloroflexota bacterium]
MPKKTPRYRLATGPDVDLAREEVRDAAGARIDEAYVRRAVEDVRAHGAGRPSLSAPGRRSPQIGVRVPETLYSAADARAKQEGTTISVVVREALERYLAE